MKKEIKKTSVEVVEAYEAPKCEVMELQAEGRQKVRCCKVV